MTSHNALLFSHRMTAYLAGDFSRGKTLAL